jgi:hypothetical protein
MSLVDIGFESGLFVQCKDYEICICSFSAKHAAFMSKSKDWLVQNQDNAYLFVLPLTAVFGTHL